MAGVAVIIGAMIASTTFFTMPVLFATLAAFLICGAGNVINDYFDYEVDKINNPTRALPSGKISLSRAYAYSILLFFIGILISYTVNVYALMIAVVNSSLLYLYPWKVKGGGGISKNLVVSYLVASPFLFGGVSAGETAEWRATLIFVLLAFFANTAREIIKDKLEPNNQELVCPSCGSENIVLGFGERKGFKIFNIIIAILSFFPLGNLKPKYYCKDCKTEIS